MPDAALELLPDDAGAAAVRQDWQRLRDAGLPSQLDHRGATNAPHLTLVAAPDVSASVAVAVAEVGRLLPLPVRASGLLVLGGERVTVARALDVPDELLAAVVRVRATLAVPPRQGWLPHVTLARHVARQDLQRALEMLGDEDLVLSLTALRRWDPTTRSVATIAGR